MKDANPYECVINLHAKTVTASRNVVHTLRKDENGVGLRINLNWRYWGIAVSWGDTVDYGNFADRGPAVLWFVGIHVGPLFITHSWPQQ